MKIALAQISPIVGDFDGNVRKISAAYSEAAARGAEIVLTPELSVCGYPLYDLVERADLLERTDASLAALAALTAKSKAALVVGHVGRNPLAIGLPFTNQASVLAGGRVIFEQAKSLLPTYDVFDEARYFEGAKTVGAFTWAGERFALAICEDLWAADPHHGRRLYGKDPVAEYAALGVDALLCIAASPYEFGKREHREAVHTAVARRLGRPLFYVNQVGATDEVLFDGGSFVTDSGGEIVGSFPTFASQTSLVDLESGGGICPVPDPYQELGLALTTGIREYFGRTRAKEAIVGLSGGIDSALVAALCTKALGPKHVIGIAMPGPYSSGHSLEDAEHLAKNLGCRFEVRPIRFAYSSMLRELGGPDECGPLATQNLQSRLRGLILMQRSNSIPGGLVVTTGNKSEIAMGYCTLYGDMVGALAPIGDLYKTQVYELARTLNNDGEVIPARTLAKPPSAELAPDQKDEDSLPPYEVLDPFLKAALEEGASPEALKQRFGRTLTRHSVEGLLAQIDTQEFKRRQGAPVLKISPKAFGIGRRVPIAKNWSGGIKAP